MIPVTLFGSGKVAVLGLARSGLAAAEALQLGGAKVLAWDDSAARRDAAATRDGLALADLASADLSGVRALVLSPGIPHRFPAPHPAVARIRDAGGELIGDIELLARTQRAARYVGITGTNGKSTTTALLGHILESAGRRVEVGGNIGKPALLLDALDAQGIYVLEMSSYQLELTHSLAYDVAVLLNVTPDHLDRHGGMEGYVAAKRRIFAAQRMDQAAVIGVDDPICRGIAGALEADGRKVVRISVEAATPGGVYVAEGWLVDDTTRDRARILDLRRATRLPGRHNWQNAAAAYAAARLHGIEASRIVDGVMSFPGLAHRQELVATIDGVRYVNDSKATNADAAANALACYDAIHWILGGRAKEGGIAALTPYFPRIRRAYLIGEASDQFARTLEGAVPYTRCGELATAVAAACAEGRRDEVVLLSPACASFDQFASFEERGQVFRSLVEALPGVRA
jgi:UDP-N-acetylmuramoylalanine--D-glutamate ligase